ncbi:hypothetical protein DFQ26_009012 [Actinomortierella ambigua]|nr:hypothetical protein DFQ26_009012 [Actinomortierella ambigua]
MAITVGRHQKQCYNEASSAFYLFGGETPTSRFNDAYSLQGDDRGVWRWTVLDTPPNITRRVNAACAVHNNQLILWGGTGNISDIEADAIILSSLNGGPGGGGVNVDPEPNNDSPSSSPPLGAIIGGTVGGLALLLLLGFGMVMFCRRKKRNAGHHRRGKAVSGEHDVYETKSRGMPSGGVVDGSSHGDGDGGGAVVPLVPSPFEIDHDDGSMGPYSRSINARSPTESSSFTAASTLHYPPHHQPLMDHAMVPAISSPEYLSHSASPSPPLPPIMTSQPFGYHQHQYPYATSSSSSSPLQGSPSHRLSLSAPLPLPTEVEIQSRAIPPSGNNNGNGVVTPHQRFEPHGVPYTMTNAPPPLPPPSSRPMYGSGGPPFTQASMSAPTSAPFPGSTSVHNPMSPPSPPPPPQSSSQEPEWDVLIPVTDEDDMSTQAALGMTSSVRGLSASHREFKHELPDSDVEEDDNDEGDATAGMSTAVSAARKKLGGGGPKNGKPGSTAAETFGRRSSVSSLASHPESESGIGFLELWVPPADEPPVPPVPQSHR